MKIDYEETKGTKKDQQQPSFHRGRFSAKGGGDMVSTALNRKAEEKMWIPPLPALLNLPHVEKTFWRGMPVYSLEDPAAHLYVVLKGRVKIVRASSEGQQKIV
ncbi:MAG TPA: hypothetical protein VJS64_07575 [Pyrinomonadaceae bacterium]|nr:hypothetical protein [Pyrinomonadaceae bacterium]